MAEFIASSDIPKQCDLLVVDVSGKPYLVETQPGIAKVGDLVDFMPRGEDLCTGWVVDKLPSEPFGELYAFIGRITTIHNALSVYSKTWSNPTLDDGW